MTLKQAHAINVVLRVLQDERMRLLGVIAGIDIAIDAIPKEPISEFGFSMPPQNPNRVRLCEVCGVKKGHNAFIPGFKMCKKCTKTTQETPTQ